MRKPGILFLFLAVLILLIDFLPDRTEKVQFLYKGADILNSIDAGYSEIPFFAGDDFVKAYLRNSELVIDTQIPKTILEGRRGRVQMIARWNNGGGGDQTVEVPEGFKMEIKSHLDFPRQFVEPAGYNSKPISIQVSPTFHWNLMADQPETLKGKLWTYLVLQKQQGMMVEYPLLARDIEIPVATLLGMNVLTSRVVSLCLSIIGIAFLLLDKFIRKNRAIKKIDMIK